MTAALCLMTHAVDPDRPRRAADGARLCIGHHKELGQLVTDMPAIYDDLERALSTGGHRGGTSTGLTVDERVADHRRLITSVLASWCRVVAEDHAITPPPTPDISRTAPWLAVHVDWCAAQEWVADMLGELRQLARRARSITDIPARRVPLDERCLAHTGGQRCDGTITVVVHGDDWWADCSTCDEPQDAAPYLRGTGWVTSDGVIRLAHVFGVPCSEEVVRQWRHRKRIKGRDDGTRIWYSVATVHEYLAKRTRRLAA